MLSKNGILKVILFMSNGHRKPANRALVNIHFYVSSSDDSKRKLIVPVIKLLLPFSVFVISNYLPTFNYF